MLIIDETEAEKNVEGEGEERKVEDGIDTRFNERFQKRMETLKRAVSACALCWSGISPRRYSRRVARWCASSLSY
jgi:hypothetical protein